MNKAQMKIQLRSLYQEAREAEIQVHRGGINHTEALKVSLTLAYQMLTLLDEIVDKMEEGVA